MNTKTLLLLLLVPIIMFAGFFFSDTIGTQSNSKNTLDAGTAPTPSQTEKPIIPVEKVEVVNFFGSQRCVSCLAIGKLTKKTIEEKFSEEVKSGKVAFLEINVDLPENKDMVSKYQARGSSLFLNAIRNSADDIEEDVTVWRLTNSDAQFVAYLENKINRLLGK